MNEFYVYVLFRPNGLPCYVGKGKNKRFLYHERIGQKHYNKHLSRIIAKAGGSLPKVKIKENLSEVDAFETEKIFIAAIGREPNGPLVNITDGGEGAAGFKPSPETILKMTAGARAAMLGKPKSAAHREKLKLARSEKPGFLGKHHSEETKNKMREARKRQKPITEETRMKMRESWRGRTDIVRNSEGRYV